jgi:hypothetical protein
MDEDAHSFSPSYEEWIAHAVHLINASIFAARILFRKFLELISMAWWIAWITSDAIESNPMTTMEFTKPTCTYLLPQLS